jgi:PLP dependent protein
MYKTILENCNNANATLVAVSKTKPILAIEQLYAQGQRHFGENKVQELVEKQEALPKDILWHVIGHLQTNKVKYIVPFVHLIHSVDSLKLLQEINKEAAKCNRVVDVLLQLFIATEETKFGLLLQEAMDLLEIYASNKEAYANVRIVGVMGMASFTDNSAQVQKEFLDLKNSFAILKNTYFVMNDTFKEISMGMSADYALALNCGSTMVRVGSLLFGAR